MSASATLLLISPLLSSLLLYQSAWQKIDIGAAAAFLPSPLRPAALRFRAHRLSYSRILFSGLLTASVTVLLLAPHQQ